MSEEGQCTGWSIKTGPKTKFDNSIFYKRILENKVALDSWDWKILPFLFFKYSSFLSGHLLIDYSPEPFSSYCRWRLLWLLNPCLLSLCRHHLTTLWQFGDYLDILFSLGNSKVKFEMQKIRSASWPINIPNREVSFPSKRLRRSKIFRACHLCAIDFRKNWLLCLYFWMISSIARFFLPHLFYGVTWKKEYRKIILKLSTSWKKLLARR